MQHIADLRSTVQIAVHQQGCTTRLTTTEITDLLYEALTTLTPTQVNEAIRNEGDPEHTRVTSCIHRLLESEARAYNPTCYCSYCTACPHPSCEEPN